MDGAWEWFRWLYDQTGINLSVFYDPYFRNKFAAGAWLSVWLAALILTLTTVIGLVGAWLLGVRFRLVRWLVRAYIELFRNTPKLVQLYFFYFGVSNLLPRIDDGTGLMVPIIGAFPWVIIAFSVHYAAFTIEVFRSGIEAVPQTTVDAAQALGMSRLQINLLVVLPLAFRICLPALNSNFVFVVKGTSLAYAVGVAEMLYVSVEIYTLSANVVEMMTILLLCYVGMVSLFVYAMNKVERSLKMPGYGT